MFVQWSDHKPFQSNPITYLIKNQARSCQVFVFDAILMKNKYNIGMCVCYVRLNIAIVPHSEISERLITMFKCTFTSKS